MTTCARELPEVRRGGVGFGLLVTALAPVVPQLLGSVFNIWYNQAVVMPLLATEALRSRFLVTCLWYNVLVYPVAVWLWARSVYALGPCLRRMGAGASTDEESLRWCRRRVVDLPWIGTLVSGMGWVLCLPVFLISLWTVGEGLPRTLLWHLPISFLVSAFISVTHSFFLVELATQRTLFPIFFAEARADLLPGAHALSLRGRGVLWAVSAGICPIGSLLLLSFAPPAPGTDPAWFAVFVGSVGIAFGLCTALMMGQLVVQPIDQLRAAAHAVARGDLSVEVTMRRADEFGLLAGSFNQMIRELREKEALRKAFGLHVGRQTAERILARDPGLGGVEQVITVMFVDIRKFTERSAESSPEEIVRMLNAFLRAMVEIVEERHGGMVNKFLGDGFIALFGIGEIAVEHADEAVRAGRAMLAELPRVNAALRADAVDPIAIGIGIHTGPAIVGSIGSPERMEFTAIGSAVNVASRIEGLTKVLNQPLLVSEETHRLLHGAHGLTALPPQAIRGLEEAVTVYAG